MNVGAVMMRYRVARGVTFPRVLCGMMTEGCPPIDRASMAPLRATTTTTTVLLASLVLLSHFSSTFVGGQQPPTTVFASASSTESVTAPSTPPPISSTPPLVTIDSPRGPAATVIHSATAVRGEDGRRAMWVVVGMGCVMCAGALFWAVLNLYVEWKDKKDEELLKQQQASLLQQQQQASLLVAPPTPIDHEMYLCMEPTAAGDVVTVGGGGVNDHDAEEVLRGEALVAQGSSEVPVTVGPTPSRRNPLAAL